MSKEKTSPKRKRTLGQWLDSPNVSGYVFVGPFIIGFLAFMMVPMLLSFAFSFTRYNILQSPTFIGLENYITMFTDDPKFWKVFGVTMYYVAFTEQCITFLPLSVPVWRLPFCGKECSPVTV